MEQVERTLVLIKPDGVQRRLIGEILSRFERAGLEIKALKILKPSLEILEAHYPSSQEWFLKVGQKMLEFYQEKKLDVKEKLGTNDPLQLGQMVKKWLLDYMSSGAVVAVVLAGYHAVDNVRKICGYTYPYSADVGTIRGDFALDSPTYANLEGRAVRNLVHASENVEEAEREIKLWFRKEEILD